MDQTIIGSNRKIDPSRRAHLKPDMTPDHNDRVDAREKPKDEFDIKVMA